MDSGWTVMDRHFRGMLSVKGVVRRGDGIVLLKNQRDEWELPGGKLEVGESIESCLVREFQEELGISVAIGPLLDAGLHHVYTDIAVVVYGCHADPLSDLRHSDEHRTAGCFSLSEIDPATIAPLYLRSITAWLLDPRSDLNPSPGPPSLSLRAR